MQLERTIKSAFFITFNGDCKKAFAVYQECFDGELSFETFEKPIEGINQSPVIFGSMVSETITLYGSDLVHNEGRRAGNIISIYICCEDAQQRLDYLGKLDGKNVDYSSEEFLYQQLIEITDAFQVRWVFGI